MSRLDREDDTSPLDFTLSRQDQILLLLSNFRVQKSFKSNSANGYSTPGVAPE